MTAIALDRAAKTVGKALTDSGRSLTEALGGFWQGVNEDPTFMPLDEFVAARMLEAAEGDFDTTDLVLESEAA